MSFMQLEWGLSAEDPLEYSCAVEALMAAWIGGKLPASVNKIAVPYAHQAGYSCPRIEKILFVVLYPLFSLHWCTQQSCFKS